MHNLLTYYDVCVLTINSQHAIAQKKLIVTIIKYYSCLSFPIQL